MTETTMRPLKYAPKIIALGPFLGIALFVCIAQPCCARAASPLQQATATQEQWQKEFDDICAKTQDAMTFSAQELTELVQRCDTLLPQLEKLDETQRKVFTGRLRMCRGLYAYVLASKNTNETPKK